MLITVLLRGVLVVSMNWLFGQHANSSVLGTDPPAQGLCHQAATFSWALSGSAPLQGLKVLPDPDPYRDTISLSPCPALCLGGNLGTWAGRGPLVHIPWWDKWRGMTLMWDVKSISQCIQSFPSVTKGKLC